MNLELGGDPWKWYYSLGGTQGFPDSTSGNEPAYQCRRQKRHRFSPWARKILWRRKWWSTPIFLPGKSHGQRSLAGYSPGVTEPDMTERRAAEGSDYSVLCGICSFVMLDVGRG